MPNETFRKIGYQEVPRKLGAKSGGGNSSHMHKKKSLFLNQIPRYSGPDFFVNRSMRLLLGLVKKENDQLLKNNSSKAANALEGRKILTNGE